MKTKSAILAIAASMLGVAFVTPDASALPPSKTSGAKYVHKRNAAKMTCCQSAMKDCSAMMKECCMTGAKKSIGLAVNKDATVRRHFRGGRKGPTFHKRSTAYTAAASGTATARKSIGLSVNKDATVRRHFAGGRKGPTFHRR